MTTIVRRLITFALTLAALAPSLAAMPSPALAAATIYVDDDATNNGSVKCPGTLHTTLQQGVNAAVTSPATVIVCPGSYPDTLVISGKSRLKLLARGDAVLKPAAGFTGTLVDVSGSSGVTFQGFTVDGGGALGAADSTAIAYNGSYGAILRNRVLGWHEPDLGNVDYTDVAIGVNGSMGKPVKIDHNTIYDFQYYGILAVSPGKVTISRNNLAATGDGNFTAFGVELRQALSGSVTGNTIRSTADLYDAGGGMSGIKLVESSNIKVRSNTMTGVSFGIAIESRCAALTSANKNSISSNRVYGAQTGVSIFLLGLCSPHADHNTVTGNRFYFNQGGGTNGVSINVVDPGGIAAGTIIKKNTFAGYGSDPVHETGTGISGTVKTPNKVMAYPPPGA